MIGFLRHNGIALVALFVALGGTGYAAAGGGGATVSQVISPGPGVKKHCGLGKVDGYATVTGGSRIPTSFTSSPRYLIRPYNCAGGPVQVRRVGVGTYIINFGSDPGRLGFGNVPTCVPSKGVLCPVEDGDTVSVTRLKTGADKGAFLVFIRDSTTSDPADATFDILIV